MIISNGFGLFDITGNVWERASDFYDGGYYKISPFENP
jgi:formylglycine-generating enzyme required for sulfatase activity